MQTDPSNPAALGAAHLVRHCASLRAGEKALVVSDGTTVEVGRLIAEAAGRLGGVVEHVTIAPLGMHGREPPADVGEAMLGCDVVFGVTGHSMAHTKARGNASRRGMRYLSLPDYTLDLLGDPAILCDYRATHGLVRAMADALTGAREIVVSTAAGTRIAMSAADRVGNCCPGYVAAPGELGSPPDIEANVSPIETSAEGVVVVDGSIPYPGLGLVEAPVRLEVKHGSIVAIEGPRAVRAALDRLFDSEDPRKTRVLAECGIGLNRAAKLTGAMLTDEGAFGHMHFGFGANCTVGGRNSVPFHLDFVFRAATLEVDGRRLLDAGEPTIAGVA
jgi:2,5-dihydroxypyridine 5,6-dioxygenase